MKRYLLMAVAIACVYFCIEGCNNPFDNNNDDNNKRTKDTSYNPTIDPANFVSQITNEYLPLIPGTIYIYQGETEDGVENGKVVVTHETKTILGVVCTVVADTVWLENSLIEATFDWYTQDIDGNVWYFGEDSKQFENGVFEGTEGSWEAGVDDAKPGIVMEANPEVGDIYRQEYYFNNAEDMAEVLALDENATVPYGSFTGCLKTKDYTPLESDVAEHKYYAPNIGVVLEVTVKGGSDRNELISITTE